MKKFICLVRVNVCEYVVNVYAESFINAEHIILDNVTQYKGERKVYCSAHVYEENAYDLLAMIERCDTIDIQGIKRVIKNYCDECERVERERENVEKVTKICELLNNLNSDTDLETLRKNGLCLDAMIKELKKGK